MGRTGWWAAALLLVLAGCSGGGGELTLEAPAPSDATGASAGTGDADAAGEAARAEEAAGAPESAAAGDADDPGVAPEGDAAAVAQAPGEQALPPPVATNDRVIREGTIGIEVEAGAFDPAYARVVEAARREGGTVVSSTTRTEEGDGGTFGSVTVRVPAERYEDLLLGVAAIGEVRSREISAQDVSAEFVDLESRERNLEAQERFYLGLLDQAQGVQDAIALRQQLDQITSQLEQVRGRIAFIDERTTFSTLTVELFEPGAALPVIEDTENRPTLVRAWRVAQDAFVNVVGALLVVASFLLPILVLAAAAWLVSRAARPRPRVAARPPEPPAPETSEREPQLTR